jgi:hypothetical protein
MFGFRTVPAAMPAAHVWCCAQSVAGLFGRNVPGGPRSDHGPENLCQTACSCQRAAPSGRPYLTSRCEVRGTTSARGACMTTAAGHGRDVAASSRRRSPGHASRRARAAPAMRAVVRGRPRPSVARGALPRPASESWPPATRLDPLSAAGDHHFGPISTLRAHTKPHTNPMYTGNVKGA